ncbi:MAG: hypothetical protein AMS27_12800 [Bacteroides sp. SM23_62_1]|nr:MAG: hypothetical protein AMS27_12800 [Bacteroides sp. SM23_62_1]
MLMLKKMKKQQFTFMAVFVLVAVIAVYLWMRYTGDQSELKMITIDGIYSGHNYSRSWLYFGSAADSGEINALPVSNGDLLFLFLDEDGDYPSLMRYHESDGQHLVFESDTSSPYIFYMNHKPTTLYIDNDLNWTYNLSGKNMKDLRLIYFMDDSIKENMFSVVGEIAEVNPDVGLVFDNDNKYLFYKILSLFKPEWISIPSLLMDTIDEKLSTNLQNLKLLCLQDGDYVNYDVLSRLTNLESLIIGEWSTADTNYSSLEHLRNLRSFTAINTDIISLSDLMLPENIQKLYLIGCPSLLDIGRLQSFHKLRDLGLLGCDTLSEISVMNNLTDLRWLSLPSGISQESFDDIIAHNKSLQGLELIECEEIKSLSSLKQLNELKSLMIDLPDIDYESLKQLTKIRLIMIDKDQFEESDNEIAALKNALPETYIIPGSGICMGSGWLILIIPLLLFMVLIIRVFIK